MHRRLFSLVVAVALVVGAAPALADEAATAVAASRGGVLAVHPSIDAAAQASADRQAADGKISHAALGGVTSVCASAGEVVGVGPSVDLIFQAFAQSPVHWAVITKPGWTSIGTGVARGGDGSLYLSVIFCAETQPSAPAPPPAPPPAPAAPPSPPSPSATPGAPPVPYARMVARVGETPSYDFAEVFQMLLAGELNDMWQQVIDDVSISLAVGPTWFLPEAEWRAISVPKVV